MKKIKILTLLLALAFIVTGCSSNPITYKEINLKDAISTINDSKQITIDNGIKSVEIDKLPELELPDDVVDHEITSKQYSICAKGTNHNGDKDEVTVLALYNEENQYYLVSYAYTLKTSGDKVYTPIGFDKGTVYEVTADVYDKLFSYLN